MLLRAGQPRARSANPAVEPAGSYALPTARLDDPALSRRNRRKKTERNDAGAAYRLEPGELQPQLAHAEERGVVIRPKGRRRDAVLPARPADVRAPPASN